MKHGSSFFFLLVLLAPMAGQKHAWCAPQSTAEPGMAELVRGSHIIFVGRAVKPEAVNLKVLKPGPNTVVVLVQELLDAPPSLAGLKGQEVTVETLRPGSLRTGETAVFFTNGAIFGEHLEVKEVGQLPAPSDTASMRKQIAAVRGQAENEKIQARSQSAVLIVSGKVVEVKPLGGKLRSEHDPDWAQAVLEVTSVQKGTLPGKTLNFYFPRSTDERWYLSPKFHVGESGVWLLHREPNFGLPEGSLIAVSPLDFYPPEREPAIRALIR
ncbi:MAG: hypothetical protein WCE73_01010 [Candidatus Angelobacter sp.]